MYSVLLITDLMHASLGDSNPSMLLSIPNLRLTYFVKFVVCTHAPNWYTML